VHEVTEALDDGRIIAQGVVPVMPEDDAQSLAARVLEIEHRCYPQAILAWLGHGATRSNSVNQVRLLHPALAEARMIEC
jgi:phosphoribosylglycinamide formyltransferase-1